MNEAVKFLKMAEVYDERQPWKVLHKIDEVIGISLFAMIANANDCEEIAAFGREHESFLWEYFELQNGIPSHDTINRVFAMIPPSILQEFRSHFTEMLNTNEGEKIRKILGIDGKAQRGNASETQKANHIVSVVDEDGFCLGEERVSEKSNEITAVPILLNNLNIAGHIITADAMGTQREIVKLIRKKRADYVLALKGNHGTLHDDVNTQASHKPA